MLQAWLLLGTFLAVLVGVIGWSVGFSTKAGVFVRRYPMVLAVLTLALLGLGAAWRPPITAEHRVDALAGLPPAPRVPVVSCQELVGTLAAMGRMSGGEMTISPSGEIQTDEAIWARVPEEYRETLLLLAARAARCSRPGQPAEPIVVRSKATNEVYQRLAPPQGQ